MPMILEWDVRRASLWDVRRVSTYFWPCSVPTLRWKTVIYAVILGIINSKKRWNVLLQHTVNYGVLWGNCCIFEWCCNSIPQNTVPYHIFRAPKTFWPLVDAWYCCFWLVNIFWGVPCKRLYLLHPWVRMLLQFNSYVVIVPNQFKMYRGQIGMAASLKTLSGWAFCHVFLVCFALWSMPVWKPLLRPLEEQLI